MAYLAAYARAQRGDLLDFWITWLAADVLVGREWRLDRIVLQFGRIGARHGGRLMAADDSRKGLARTPQTGSVFEQFRTLAVHRLSRPAAPCSVVKDLGVAHRYRAFTCIKYVNRARFSGRYHLISSAGGRWGCVGDRL